MKILRHLYASLLRSIIKYREMNIIGKIISEKKEEEKNMKLMKFIFLDIKNLVSFGLFLELFQ